MRGPLTVPRTPQGRPVLIQAGSSGRGREFASRWADLIFTGDPGIEVARNHYADQKERIAAAGRDPQSVKLCPMAYAVVGETEDHAKEREQVFLNDLVHPMASLTLLSELMNYDFAKHDLDDPITDELIESVSGIRGLVQNLRAHIGDKITLRDLAGHRATLLQGPRFVGTGSRSPTRWRSGSTAVPAMDSSWPQRICPARSKTWCGWWSRNCSAAACSAPPTAVDPARSPRAATTGLRSPSGHDA